MIHAPIVKEYQQCLWNSPKALQYLTNRKINLSSIQEFGICYYDINDWDVWYDRILFPIYDLSGELVSFQGRALYDWKADRKGKYYHGTYDKSSVIYGLYNNMEDIVKKDFCVIVESPFCVAALWQIGIPAIACFGTVLTATQASMIRLATSNVILWMDNDKAGHKGAENAVKVLQDLMMNTFVVREQIGDPSDLLVAKGERYIMEVLNGSIR